MEMSPKMPAHKYKVELTESQKRRLSEVAHRGRSPARTVKRALALLKADEETMQVYVEDTGSTDSTYTDTEAADGIQYEYSVQTITAAGLSEPSAPVSVQP